MILSAITETVLLACVAAVTLMVLGVGLLIHLGRGGRPFDVRLKGLGIEVSINRSNENGPNDNRGSGPGQ